MGLAGVETERHCSGLGGSGIGDIGDVNLALCDPGDPAVRSACADSGRRRKAVAREAADENSVAGSSLFVVATELAGLLRWTGWCGS